MPSSTTTTPHYHTVIQPPPGPIVLSSDLSTISQPNHAPKVFLDAISLRSPNTDLQTAIDTYDFTSWFLVVYELPSNRSAPEDPVATVRLVPLQPKQGSDDEPLVKLDRLATVRTGVVEKLVEDALRYMAEQPGEIGSGWKGLVTVDVEVVGEEGEELYSRLGFRVDEEQGRWKEEGGTTYVRMWRRLDVKS